MRANSEGSMMAAATPLSFPSTQPSDPECVSFVMLKVYVNIQVGCRECLRIYSLGPGQSELAACDKWCTGMPCYCARVPQFNDISLQSRPASPSYT